MLKRWMAFSVFIALSGQHYLSAQDPLILEPPLPEISLEEAVDDALDEATEGEPAAEFELPEIDVIGRLNSFPTNPIPDGASITATRTTLSLAETGSSITVVTSEQLQEMQQPILSDALRQIQGVDVNRTGGPGGLTSIFLREL
jgi:outer membrane receptor protein involved in Fe transport